MLFTWFKNGKPDVSMCLNASLAGLVAITAPCDVVDGIGAFFIGLVAGILVDVVVETLDLKLHIDDPVGAVGVHFANGLWGTIAVGLFDIENGLFYGGGFRQLGVQALGVVTICAYTAVMMTIAFAIIKKTVGLRCSTEEEIRGLDVTEHGLPSAYADFTINDNLLGLPADERSETGDIPEEAAIPVTHVDQPAPAGADLAPASYGKYTKITIVANAGRFDALKAALSKIGVAGMTVTQVMGCGTQKGKTEYYRGAPVIMTLLPKVQVDIVVSTVPVERWSPPPRRLCIPATSATARSSSTMLKMSSVSALAPRVLRHWITRSKFPVSFDFFFSFFQIREAAEDWFLCGLSHFMQFSLWKTCRPVVRFRFRTSHRRPRW